MGSSNSQREPRDQPNLSIRVCPPRGFASLLALTFKVGQRIENRPAEKMVEMSAVEQIYESVPPARIARRGYLAEDEALTICRSPLDAP